MVDAIRDRGGHAERRARLDENDDEEGEPFSLRSIKSDFVTFDADQDETTIIQLDSAYDNDKGKAALDFPPVDLSTIDVSGTWGF